MLEALNLPKNGIPLHVYKMRKYGYPSGWLQEARDVFSGISIFTSPNECKYIYLFKTHFLNYISLVTIFI